MLDSQKALKYLSAVPMQPLMHSLFGSARSPKVAAFLAGVILSLVAPANGARSDTFASAPGPFYGTTLNGGTFGAGTVFSLTATGKKTILYNFGRATQSRGLNPQGSLLDVNGVLYGTTLFGGTGNKGTVFSVTASGQETVLYSFVGGTDGEYPNGVLLDVNGVLYGTTANGGSADLGTVFAVTKSGKEKVVHSFQGGADGAMPLAGLISVGGVLYGTTSSGGTQGSGTVFAVTPSGSEAILHSFLPVTTGDGGDPTSELLNVNGLLYGTTSRGGGSGEPGTVFALTTSGVEKIIYTFHGAPDGGSPSSALISVSGVFYGTTASGGTRGLGTVFAVTPSGTETVLHSFQAGADGFSPYGRLLDVNGLFYGATQGANIYGLNGHFASPGTVYTITPAGKETTLLQFAGGTDGSYPSGGLIR